MHTSYDPYDFSDGMGGCSVKKRMDGTPETVEFDCFA